MMILVVDSNLAFELSHLLLALNYFSGCWRFFCGFTKSLILEHFLLPFMAIVEPPSLEILVREPDGFVIWNGPPFADGQPSTKIDKIKCSSANFSEDGSKLMIITSDSEISIYDCKVWREIRLFKVPNLLSAVLSPCGTFLQTFQKSTSPQDRNVVLWKTETGDSVHSFSQKNMTKSTW